ncbi:MAG: EamA family transporter [Oceanobacter sp.]
MNTSACQSLNSETQNLTKDAVAKESGSGAAGRADVIRGLAAVALFALTVPLTAIALQSGWSALDIAAGRTSIAGFAALATVLACGWRIPALRHWPALILVACAVAGGFPYLLARAITEVGSGTMGVVLGLIPLATALLSALLQRQSVHSSFWFWSGAASVLTLFYFAGLPQTDLLALTGSTLVILLGCLLLAAVGYAFGARLANQLGAWQTICWVQVMALPVAAFTFGWQLGQERPQAPSMEGWLALVWLGLVSQWLGFRFWYRALAVDPVRISQLQLLQPLLTLAVLTLIAPALVGIHQWLFAVAILICVVTAMRTRQK